MGRAAALLLRELGDFEVDVLLGDSRVERARQAVAWVREGSTVRGAVEAFHLPPTGIGRELQAAVAEAGILLDCLPGSEAPRMARLARQHGLCYANLTEHVKATEEIAEIAAGAEHGFLLQTGLAPGYVNVLGNGLFQRFLRAYGVATADSLRMRVGALSTTARPPHFYGITWSAIGVATEYVEPATVIREGRRVTRPSLTDVEQLTLDGVVFEEALTSGGAADLPSALEGKVSTLDYKTLRHPGHYAWVRSVLDEAPAGSDKTQYLLRHLEQAVPHVEDDAVVIHAAVEGHDAEGQLRRLESTRTIHPTRVGARQLKAIQATTAAGLAESARLLLLERPAGVVLQSQIDPAYFMAGPFVSRVYNP
jgi:saccharopine dehydrogenase-like NADP-dependent oxidoreductase